MTDKNKFIPPPLPWVVPPNMGPVRQLAVPQVRPLQAELVDAAKASFASEFYKKLRHHIQNTENKLKEDEQLLVYHYSKGGELILVDDISYQDPNLIVLYGTDSSSNPLGQVMHMHSVELNLKVVKITNEAEPEVKRRKIGFIE